MITITLPDGSTREFDKQAIDGREIAASIGKRLAQDAVAIQIDKHLKDLTVPITQNASVAIITIQSAEGTDILRHTCSHIMAQAVYRLFPNARCAIGPIIDNGFYYDFLVEQPFTPDDLEKIEAEMQTIIKEDYPIKREEWTVEQALTYYKQTDPNPFKVELIEDLVSDRKLSHISVYKQGEFTDLCTGPHLPSTGMVPVVKLLSVAGSYWRGDERREALQRIYGTSFADEKKLKAYLALMEEAKKRDHRLLGKELDLFSIQDEGPGMAFWHQKGTVLVRQIQGYVQEELTKRGYEEIITPSTLNVDLWHQSGHYDNYRDNMYFTEVENQTYALKPMNCPGACLVYKSRLHSYRELPIRVAEFGMVHRFERSGVLHGLMRVRSFTQDDAHVYCTPEQLEEEVINIIQFVTDVYRTFGFETYDIYVSTRPKKSIGSAEDWERATKTLFSSLDKLGYSYKINEGDGAFYGPKIDFEVEDALGRMWQLGTCQVDFSMPVRFDLYYEGADGNKHHPVMIHRAIVGSLERFIGILIENFGGKFPLWMAPEQITIIPVSRDYNDYSKTLQHALIKEGFRCKIDKRDEKMGYKIRHAQLMKVPYMFIIGEKEQTSNTIAVRSRDKGDLGAFPLKEVLEKLKEEQRVRSLTTLF